VPWAHDLHFPLAPRSAAHDDGPLWCAVLSFSGCAAALFPFFPFERLATVNVRLPATGSHCQANHWQSGSVRLAVWRLH
jgi:hypothetical protein